MAAARPTHSGVCEPLQGQGVVVVLVVAAQALPQELAGGPVLDLEWERWGFQVGNLGGEFRWG